MKQKRKKSLLIWTRLIATLAFCFVLVIGMLLGSAFFFRPSTSNVEKRELTKFPAFTLSSFMDGSYFSDISLWYSDTYPMRDSFIAASQSFKQSYGPAQKTMMVGGSVEKDEIPTKKKTTKTAKAKELPENYALDDAVQNQIMEGLYVEDGAAYSMYYFNQNAADIYTEALNTCAKELEGQADVYSMLVPNNAIVLPKEKRDKLGGSDMEAAMEYYYNGYENVTGLDVIGALEKHSDEYLYFRTDHHWTTKGAYYAYREFCKEKGFKPAKLSGYKETYRFEPFLGTFYNQLHLAEMEANPDYVDAYVPNSTNDMKFWDESGNEVDWKVVRDVSDEGSSNGYYCFIGGDKPLSIIDNPKKDDGSSVLVIKESYGNSFVPYLVDHYDKVYIADFRYTTINIPDYVKENKIEDVIFENNMTIVANPEIASKISGLITKD